MLSKVREKLEKAYLAPRDFNSMSHIHMLEHEIYVVVQRELLETIIKSEVAKRWE